MSWMGGSRFEQDEAERYRRMEEERLQQEQYEREIYEAQMRELQEEEYEAQIYYHVCQLIDEAPFIHAGDGRHFVEAHFETGETDGR